MFGKSMSYRNITETLSEACANDLDSPGLKLLQETADSIEIAMTKLKELEKYIIDHEVQTRARDAVSNIQDKLPPDNFDRKDAKQDERLKIYFSLDKNVAGYNVVDAFQKKGFLNFNLNSLMNKENFAYGFITFTNRDTFMDVISLSRKIKIGESPLTIHPATSKLRRRLRAKNKAKGKRQTKTKEKTKFNGGHLGEMKTF